LPEVARNAGRMVARIRREATGTLEELRRSADLDDLSNLKDLRDELRATSAALKPQSFLTGPMASDARPKVGAGKTVRAELPPPYDTDAT